MFRPLALTLAAAGLWQPVLAGTAQYGTIHIPHSPAAVTIDAKFDDAAWQHAKEIELNYEVSPGENIQAPVTTKAWLMEDGENLYVAFHAMDPNPEQIRAFLRDRDKAWPDDMVGIKIDTYNDGNKAYQFFVNPFGVQQDAIENELIGRESDAWDAIWDSAGELTADGYRVEIAIPLRVLSFDAKADEQQWAIELVRFYPRTERHRLSNTIKSRNLACTLCQMTTATGMAGLAPARQLQWVPTFTASQQQTRDLGPTTAWEDDNEQDIGLDVKWGITPDMSLYTTINPDFSQIEADSGQLSINNNFSLFNDEKRGFFLDNADVFETPFQNLVYTRNIAAPEVGSKLTGRSGDHTYGVMAARDKETNFIVPGNMASSVATLAEKSTSAALRYRYDQGNALSFGTLVTGRFAGDYHNLLAGFDAKYRLSDTDTLTGQVISTNTQYPESLSDEFKDEEELNGETAEIETELSRRTARDDDFSGSALNLRYEHDERDWHSTINYRKRSAGFRADLGFVNQTDFEKFVIGGGRYWYKEGSWWNKMHLWGDWDISHNAAGELLEKEGEINLRLDAGYQSIIEGGLYTRELAIRQDDSLLAIDGNSELFTEKGVRSYLEIIPSAGLNLNLYARMGDKVDHANKQLGEETHIRPRLEWNINKHLLLKVSHTHRTLDVDEGRLYTANLTDLRLVWQFDVRSFLRFNAINTDISRDPALYHFDEVDSEYRSLSTQLLYSYKLNPQSLVFLGYADNGYQDDDVDSLTRDQRSVFVKFSYAWL